MARPIKRFIGMHSWVRHGMPKCAKLGQGMPRDAEGRRGTPRDAEESRGMPRDAEGCLGKQSRDSTGMVSLMGRCLNMYSWARSVIPTYAKLDQGVSRDAQEILGS